MGQGEPAARADSYERLREKVAAYLGERDLYVVDAFAGADPAHRLAVRVVTPTPTTRSSPGRCSSRRTAGSSDGFARRRSSCTRPALEADPATDGTRTGTFIALHPSRGEVLIGGTFYAGEIKKSIFTLMNDRLPLEGVFPMHCSANVGDAGDVAIFFGLSGTGKTTLSADPERHLIGDDEHGWGDTGVFNFEGGCYAKVIRLSPEAEPEIYETTRTFGTLLENVVVDERRAARPRQRREDREHARRLQPRGDLERAAGQARRPSDERRLPDRRRVRGDAADRAAHGCAGALPLPVRLHGAARRHGDRRHRAGAGVLAVLRRARSCRSGPRSTRACSARSSPRTPVGVAREHGLDGRSRRSRWASHADRGDARAAARGALGRARRRRVPHRPGLRVRGAARRARRRHEAARPALDLARPEGPTTRRPASSPRCSARTSSSSTTSTPRSPPPGRFEGAGEAPVPIGSASWTPRTTSSSSVQAARACVPRSRRSTPVPTSRSSRSSTRPAATRVLPREASTRRSGTPATTLRRRTRSTR